MSAFLTWLENVWLSAFIRESALAFPVVETVHVIALALVVGSIAIVDLRLLGLASTDRTVSQLCREVLPWTWGAFVLAVITGVLMFASHANDYFANIAFQVKILLLLAAGANMLAFQLFTYRGVARWDRDAKLPLPARIAGAVSLTCWIGVVFFGRWIGFTMTPT
jgi:uncharacterized membrane protein